jgi:hypothetical protein
MANRALHDALDSSSSSDDADDGLRACLQTKSSIRLQCASQQKPATSSLMNLAFSSPWRLGHSHSPARDASNLFPPKKSQAVSRVLLDKVLQASIMDDDIDDDIYEDNAIDRSTTMPFDSYPLCLYAPPSSNPLVGAKTGIKSDDKLSRYAVLSNQVGLTERPSLSLNFMRPSEPIPLVGRGAILDSEIPAASARYLRDYQMTGVKWLWEKYISGIGGILGK